MLQGLCCRGYAAGAICCRGYAARAMLQRLCCRDYAAGARQQELCCTEHHTIVYDIDRIVRIVSYVSYCQPSRISVVFVSFHEASKNLVLETIVETTLEIILEIVLEKKYPRLLLAFFHLGFHMFSGRHLGSAVMAMGQDSMDMGLSIP